MIVTPDGGSTPGPSFRSEAPLPEPQEWYALRVRSQREFRVRDELTALGTEHFLPTYDATVRWSDREKRVEKLFFPGYIFARLAERDARRAPGDINYVMEVLGIAGEPLAIPPEQIDALQRAIESRLTVECCPYVAGSLVRVKTGPLAGVSGVVERISGETRITITCELLRRAVRVQIDAADLEAAADVRG
jgi:transcriptional antiterminator NusG